MAETAFRLRQAGPRDIAEMHRVRMAVRENRLVRTITAQDYLEHMTVAGRGWVAEIDGVLRGFAVANRTNGNIWALFIEPGYESLGMGRALQAMMLEWMRAAGCRAAWLETGTGTRAERFYRESGWQHVATDGGDARFERTLEAD